MRERMASRLIQVWSAIDRWLDRGRIRFACLGFLAIGVLLLVMSFASTDDNLQTRFGDVNLGADFAGFYYAGQILNGPSPEKLYDPQYQDEVYYQLLPAKKDKDYLRYVHPPFIAYGFSFLARMPYPRAYSVWLLISASLYVAGLLITRKATPAIPAKDWSTAILLAIVFEPFLMECWLGGQLSALAFFCIALAFYWNQTNHPLLSGLALGCCLYKPTLLLLLLPMLLLARCLWTLVGVGMAGIALTAVSFLAVGKETCLSYIPALLGFTSTTTGAGMERKDWKFVDLNFFFRNLFGEPTLIGTVLWVLLAAGPLAVLLISWWRYPRLEPDRRQLIWAGTLAWTLVINLYMGIYDVILVVLAAIWTADTLYQSKPASQPLPAVFRAILIGLFLVSWFTQPLTRLTGIQAITVVLFMAAAYPLVLARISPRVPSPTVGGAQPDFPEFAKVSTGA
jgi:Glycosyltransferase family 87